MRARRAEHDWAFSVVLVNGDFQGALGPLPLLASSSAPTALAVTHNGFRRVFCVVSPWSGEVPGMWKGAGPWRPGAFGCDGRGPTRRGLRRRGCGEGAEGREVGAGFGGASTASRWAPVDGETPAPISPELAVREGASRCRLRCLSAKSLPGGKAGPDPFPGLRRLPVSRPGPIGPRAWEGGRPGRA